MTTERNEKEAAKLEKEALKARSDAMEAKEKKLNEGRTGKGTRFAVSMTRGKGSQEVTYEAFDETQPDTLPKTTGEFLEIVKNFRGAELTDSEIVSFLIDGFNSYQYLTASDPVAEYVEASWPADVQTRFKQMIRNYNKDTGVSIEDAVRLMKPGIVAAMQKKAESEKAVSV